MVDVSDEVAAWGLESIGSGKCVSQPERVSLRNEGDESYPEQHAEKHGSPPDCELGAGARASQPRPGRAGIFAAFLPEFRGLHVKDQ